MQNVTLILYSTKIEADLFLLVYMESETEYQNTDSPEPSHFLQG